MYATNLSPRLADVCSFVSTPLLPLRIPAFRSRFRTPPNISFRHRRTVTVFAATARTPHNNHVIKQNQVSIDSVSPLRCFTELSPGLRRHAILGISIGVLAGLIAVSQPIFVAHTLDTVLSTTTSVRATSWYPLRIAILQQALVYFADTLVNFIYVRYLTDFVDQFIASLQRKVFRTCLANDLSFFDVRGPEVSRVLTTDIPDLRNLLWNNLAYDRGLRCFVQIIVGSTLALIVEPVLSAVIFVCILPPLAITAGRLGLKKKAADGIYADALDELRFTATQTLDNLRTVKTYGGERIESESFTTDIDTALAHSKEVGRARAKLELMLRITLYFTLIVIYTFGAYCVSIGVLSTKRLLAASFFYRILLFSLVGYVYTWNDVSSIQGCLNRTYDLLDRASNELSATRTLPYARMPQTRSVEFEFRKVSFCYPTRRSISVIDNLSFIIKRGTTTALVGESGAGKTTIASMVTRLYKPSSGDILLNGVDIHSLKPEEFYRSIALVNQAPEMFKGSVRFNIAYGCPEATDEEIKAAAIAANADEFINDLPNGYDTTISKGSALSGGQRQRITIARAILRNTPVLVFDEYTSALDSESEAAIQRALSRLISGRTVLVIAHRLSTIRNADRIMFMRGGRIVECGTYDELMSQPDGAFRQMVAANSKAEVND